MTKSIEMTPSAGLTVMGTVTSPFGPTVALAGRLTVLVAAAGSAQLQITTRNITNESVLTVFIPDSFPDWPLQAARPSPWPVSPASLQALARGPRPPARDTIDFQPTPGPTATRQATEPLRGLARVPCPAR